MVQNSNTDIEKRQEIFKVSQVGTLGGTICIVEDFGIIFLYLLFFLSKKILSVHYNPLAKTELSRVVHEREIPTFPALQTPALT